MCEAKYKHTCTVTSPYLVLLKLVIWLQPDTCTHSLSRTIASLTATNPYLVLLKLVLWLQPDTQTNTHTLSLSLSPLSLQNHYKPYLTHGQTRNGAGGVQVDPDTPVSARERHTLQEAPLYQRHEAMVLGFHELHRLSAGRGPQRPLRLADALHRQVHRHF